MSKTDVKPQNELRIVKRSWANNITPGKQGFQSPYPFPRLCRWPGCLNPSNHLGYSCCDLHHNIWRYRHAPGRKDWYIAKRNRRRAIKLAAWLTRDPRRWRYGAPPLTPEQQLIKEKEYQRLCEKRPPQSIFDKGRLASLAAIWARKGGYQAFQHYGAIKAREAGWRRKWLRSGEYDKDLLASELARLTALAKKQP